MTLALAFLAGALLENLACRLERMMEVRHYRMRLRAIQERRRYKLRCLMYQLQHELEQRRREPSEN